VSTHAKQAVDPLADYSNAAVELLELALDEADDDSNLHQTSRENSRSGSPRYPARRVDEVMLEPVVGSVADQINNGRPWLRFFGPPSAG